ncbi:MAG: hypothetical protein ACTHK7_12855 [Aureliella sp.]
MRQSRADEMNRATAVSRYLAAMIGAACIGVSQVFEMPSDFANLGLYVLFAGCAALVPPERALRRTVYWPIGLLLAVTVFSVSAILERPPAFAGVPGMLGFMLLVASSLAIYWALAWLCGVFLRPLLRRTGDA